MSAPALALVPPSEASEEERREAARQEGYYRLLEALGRKRPTPKRAALRAV